LSEKAKNDSLIIVDSLDLAEIKTKDLKKSIDELNLKGSILIALGELNQNTIKSARNLEKVSTIQATDLNCLDLLNHKYLVIAKDGIEKIKETFLSAK